MKSEIERFERVIAMVRQEFPHLAMEVSRGEHHSMEASADLAQQPGLDFDVHIDLQADALNLCVAGLWVEMFPCSKSEVFEPFMGAVRGVLSGEYRIRKSYVGSHLSATQLERPENERWIPVATDFKWSWLIPRRRTHQIVQNRAAH